MAEAKPVMSGYCHEEDYRGAGALDGSAASKYRKLLDMVVKFHPDGAPRRLLDVGCGVGGFLECCRERGIECVGIEGADFALRVCREKGLTCQKLDLEKDTFPFEGARFDVVFCNQVIEHLTPESGRRLVEESFRVLTESGMFMVFTPSYYDRLNRTRPFHLHCYRPSELRAVLKRAGFEEIVHIPAAIPFHVLKKYAEGEDVNLRKRRILADMALNLLFLIFDAEALDETAHFVCYKRRYHARDLGNRRVFISSLLENVLPGHD